MSLKWDFLLEGGVLQYGTIACYCASTIHVYSTGMSTERSYRKLITGSYKVQQTLLYLQKFPKIENSTM